MNVENNTEVSENIQIFAILLRMYNLFIKNI